MRLPIVIALNTSIKIIIRDVVQLMVASLRSAAGNSADARDYLWTLFIPMVEEKFTYSTKFRP